MSFNSNLISELRLIVPLLPRKTVNERHTEPESPHKHVDFVVTVVGLLEFSCLWKRHLLPAAAVLYWLPNVSEQPCAGF
jgi:hypothetical protein